MSIPEIVLLCLTSFIFGGVIGAGMVEVYYIKVIKDLAEFFYKEER